MRLTLQEMVLEVWNALGDPTNLAPFTPGYEGDLTYFDLTGRGAQQIINALNRAQQAVAYWKDGSSNRQFRWRDGLRPITVTRDELSIQVWREVGDGPAELRTDLGNQGTQWEGRYLNVNGKVSEVRAQTVDAGGWLWLFLGQEDVVGEVVAGDPPVTAAVRWPWLSLPTDVDFIEVMSVKKGDGTDLARAPRDADFTAGAMTWDSVSRWQRRNRRIYVDGLPGDRYFLVSGAVAPRLMAAADDESELPATHHWALVLHALGWGSGLQQEMDVKLRYQGEFRDFMRTTQHFDDYGWNYLQGGGSVVRFS